MTAQHTRNPGRRALLALPLFIAPAGFLGYLFWFRPHNTTLVLILTAVFSIFVLAYSNYLARRLGRRMDEVQIASQRFATYHGWTAGIGVTMLLLLLPPVSKGLIDLTELMASRAPTDIARQHTAAQLGLYFGFALLVLVQTLCIFVATVVWHRRMRAAPEPS